MLLSRTIDDFQAEVSRAIYIDCDAVGQHYITTPYAYDDGDVPIVALIEDGGGDRMLLSDLGNALFRMDYERQYANRSVQKAVSRALLGAGITRHNDELTKPLPYGQYVETALDFVHTLLKIDQMGREVPVGALAKMDPPAAAVGAPGKPDHKADVEHLVKECLPNRAVRRNWHDARYDPDGAYPVDFEIKGGKEPLFLHAPVGKAAVQSAVIAIYRFSSLAIQGRHVAVLPGSRVEKRALIQLGDACETTFRDLAAERSSIKAFLREAVAD